NLGLARPLGRCDFGVGLLFLPTGPGFTLAPAGNIFLPGRDGRTRFIAGHGSLPRFVVAPMRSNQRNLKPLPGDPTRVGRSTGVSRVGRRRLAFFLPLNDRGGAACCPGPEPVILSETLT